jgi:hypothetical protein
MYINEIKLLILISNWIMRNDQMMTELFEVAGGIHTATVTKQNQAMKQPKQVMFNYYSVF